MDYQVLSVHIFHKRETTLFDFFLIFLLYSSKLEQKTRWLGTLTPQQCG